MHATYSFGSDRLVPGDTFYAFPTVLAVIPAALLLGGWLLLARSHFIQGDAVEHPNRVAQLYGYAVCLIAVVVFLVSSNSLVNNLIALGDPLQAQEARFGFEPSVTSFEAYRATYDASRRFMVGPNEAKPPSVDSIPEPVLRTRYEALRADRLARARFEAKRSLATSGLSLLLAAVLFVLHWRWLRPKGDGAASAAVAGSG